MSHKDNDFKNGGFVNDHEALVYFADVVFQKPVAEVRELLQESPELMQLLIQPKRRNYEN